MKLEMEQRMEQVTDPQTLLAEARASNAKPEDWFFEFAAPLLRAIDALIAERDSALDDHARRYNELLVSEQENQRLRAKLAKATEALTAINEYRPPDYEEEPYVSIASFCKTKARAALAAIKETTNG